jgi:hypothetical protein
MGYKTKNKKTDHVLQKDHFTATTWNLIESDQGNYIYSFIFFTLIFFLLIYYRYFYQYDQTLWCKRCRRRIHIRMGHFYHSKRTVSYYFY